MKGLKICIVWFALLAVACSGDTFEQTDGMIDGLTEIQLNGELMTTEVSTRGIGPITGTKPGSALTLDLFRVDANVGTASDYTTNTTWSKIGGTNTMSTAGALTFGTTQYYLADPDRNCKFIGLYPAGGTYDAANHKITYSSFNGTDDIMFGAPIQGSRGTKFSAAMPFSHLLTRVRVYVKATDATIAALWGNVTTITINGKQSAVVVTLPTTGGTGASAAHSGTTSAMTVTELNGDVALSATAKEYGYAMFPPVSASSQLTLNITTSLGGSAQSVTTAALATMVAGKIYDVTITFKATGITATATLTDWTSGGTTTGDLV